MRQGASLSYVSLDLIETQQSRSITLNLHSGKREGQDVVLARQCDGDGWHGGRERVQVQVVVRLHSREHEVRPELSLLLVAAAPCASMARMERWMTPQQRSVGGAAGLVHVWNRARALRAERGSPRLDLGIGVGELAGVVTSDRGRRRRARACW